MFFEHSELDSLFSNWSSLIGGGGHDSAQEAHASADETDDFFKPKVNEQCAQM